MKKNGISDFVYHLVPKSIFDIFFDGKVYNCLNKKEWNYNSDFLHTSPTKKQLKEQVADKNWKNYYSNEIFLLLKIRTKNMNLKITAVEINGYIYHHIWGSIPKKHFDVEIIKRDLDGSFIM